MNPILRSLLRQGVKTNFNSTPLPGLVNSLQQSLATTTNRKCFSESAEKNYDRNEIEKLIKNNKVVVFMKGNPESPRCGFSNAVVQIMRMHGVDYDSHDVLQSEELRQGIKDFSNWPTIPQVFINGEFVGGCDIMLQMHQSGDLIEELKKAGIRSVLLDNAPDSEKNNTSSKDK